METGVLRCWTLHVQPLNDVQRVQFELDRPHCMPAVITGLVVHDYERRFSPGEAMRTNLLCSFDLQRMSVTTASGSVYLLQGRGDIMQSGIPDDYAQAAGETQLRLSGILEAEATATVILQGDETCH